MKTSRKNERSSAKDNGAYLIRLVFLLSAFLMFMPAPAGAEVTELGMREAILGKGVATADMDQNEDGNVDVADIIQFLKSNGFSLASFAEASSTLNEANMTTNVKVLFSRPYYGGTLFMTASGTASKGADYDLPEQITVSPGATSTDIPVQIFQKEALGEPKQVKITLTGGNSLGVGLQSEHVITIKDSSPYASLIGNATGTMNRTNEAVVSGLSETMGSVPLSVTVWYDESEKKLVGQVNAGTDEPSLYFPRGVHNLTFNISNSQMLFDATASIVTPKDQNSFGRDVTSEFRFEGNYVEENDSILVGTYTETLQNALLKEQNGTWVSDPVEIKGTFRLFYDRSSYQSSSELAASQEMATLNTTLSEPNLDYLTFLEGRIDPQSDDSGPILEEGAWSSETTQWFSMSMADKLEMLDSVSGQTTVDDLIFLEAEFQNHQYTSTPSGLSIDASSCFVPASGNVDRVDTAPGIGGRGLGNIRLVQSSMGWTVPAKEGYAGAFEFYKAKGDAAKADLENLFNSFYGDSGSTNPEDIYFNFDFYLDDSLGENAGDPTLATSVLFDEEKAMEAEINYLIAWKMRPTLENVDVLDGLLDVPYYRSMGLIMLGNLELEKAFSVRFLQSISKHPENVIVDELDMLGWKDPNISQENGAWQYFDAAAKLWLDVFNSPILRSIYIARAPERSLVQSATTFETDRPSADDYPSDAPWPPEVYEGYKDAATMMRALAQKAKTTDEIARRLTLCIKRDQAAGLAENYARDIALLRGVIFQITFPEGFPEGASEKFPGLGQSFAELTGALEGLTNTYHAALNERWNALGFDKDMTLVVPGNIGDLPSTFDWIQDRILPAQNNPQGDLFLAINADSHAETTKRNFKMKASEYVTQFEDIGDRYNERLVDLCGGTLEEPNLDNPATGGGSIQDQIYNVQKAVNNIDRVIRTIQNVNAKIDIERDRVAKHNKIMDRKADLFIKYGGKKARLTEEIADIQGDMALANGLAQASSAAASAAQGKTPWGIGSGVGNAAVHTANAFVQRQMHHRIGQKQAEMAQLQARQQADFVFLDKEIIDVDSIAQIRTWMLDIYVYRIDLLDAELTLQQELDRLAQYYTQIETVIARRDREKNRLAIRSLADPTYRIEILNSALAAENQFKKAQFWIYLAARALEYKWVEDFSRNTKLARYVNDVIKSRVAGTLENTQPGSLISLMNRLDSWDMSKLASGQPDYFYWNYSIRKDAMGMTFDKLDPIQKTTQTAVQQFQDHLVELSQNPDYLVDINDDDVPDHVAIPFSTVRFSIPDVSLKPLQVKDSFGKDQTAQGQPIFDARLWNDKLDLVSVDIEGDQVYTHNGVQMPILLHLTGTGFLRTASDFIVDGESQEYRAYPVQHVKFDTAPYSNYTWIMQDYLRGAVSAKLVTEPRDIPDFVFKTAMFRERSVACTGWSILLPLDGTNFSKIRDIKIGILHKANTRQ